METIEDTLASLRDEGITLWVENGQLRFHALAGLLTAEKRERLRARKTEAVDYLTRRQASLENRIRALGNALENNTGRGLRPPYWELLQIRRPWELRTTQQDCLNNSVEFHVRWIAAHPVPCPECGVDCPRQEDQPEKTWRRSNTTFVAYVRASLPRCLCPHHGVQTARPPWLQPDAGYIEDIAGPHRGLRNRIRRNVLTILQKKEVKDRYVNAMLRLRPIVDKLRMPIVSRSVANIVCASPAVRLPFERSPAYKTYHSLAAHPLGIVGSVSNLGPLLASDYINLSCLKDPAQESAGVVIVPWRPIGHFIAAGDCEFVDSNDASLITVGKSRRLVQRLVDLLSQGWYVLSHVNKYYIPNTWWHLKQNYLHDCLLVGFDTSLSVFSMAIYSSTGEFTVVDVPFKNVAMALTTRGNRYFMGDSFCYVPVITAVRPKRTLQFQFDPLAACRNLRDFLLAQAPDEGIYGCDQFAYAGDRIMAFGYPAEANIYGVEAARGFVSHLRLCVQENRRIDMKDTRAFWEHKQIMHSNIEFWECQLPSNVTSRRARYEPVSQWAQELHRASFAYNQDDQKNSRELLAHLERAGGMLATEKEILSELLLGLCASVNAVHACETVSYRC